MRIYLVVVDESQESYGALRYASRRAQDTGGIVHILALVPKADFVPWGVVQATMEQEARDRAEALIASAAGTMFEESGRRPVIAVRVGDGIKSVNQYLDEREDVAILVLGAAAKGLPGPLVTHFAGQNAGTLPCPITIVPGALSKEQIDELS